VARQSGHRLAEERKRHGLTQAQLAHAMGVSPGRVSQIERDELATVDAVARYVEALGGRLDLVASFGDPPSSSPPPQQLDLIHIHHAPGVPQVNSARCRHIAPNRSQ
jgi:transcriptional regulator with XRE-family HTH domain